MPHPFPIFTIIFIPTSCEQWELLVVINQPRPKVEASDHAHVALGHVPLPEPYVRNGEINQSPTKTGIVYMNPGPMENRGFSFSLFLYQHLENG